MKQAEWNNITWGTNGNQMAHLKSIKISQNLKTEEQENQATGNKTIVKSLEPESLNITYSTGFAVGLDSSGEFEMLKKCAGMQDFFLLGGQKISKTNFLLDEIEMSNTILDNNGQILGGDFTLILTLMTNQALKVVKVKRKNLQVKRLYILS